MLSDISLLARTTDEQALLESEIEIMEKSFYLNKSTAWEEGLERIRTKTAEYIQQKLSKDITRETLLVQMKKAISELPILTLSIGCEPTDFLIEKIYEWVAANMGVSVVLDLIYDSAKIAGAEITYGGKVIDLSFGAKISEAIDGHAI